MIEGLIWFVASVAAFCVIAWFLPHVFIDANRAWKKRNFEPPTTTPLSAACSQCGGAWGKWSAIHEDRIPNDPSYPSRYGTHALRSQTRQCGECGYADRRVLG